MAGCKCKLALLRVVEPTAGILVLFEYESRGLQKHIQAHVRRNNLLNHKLCGILDCGLGSRNLQTNAHAVAFLQGVNCVVLAVWAVANLGYDVGVLLSEFVGLDLLLSLFQLLIKLVLELDIFDCSFVKGTLIALLSERFVGEVVEFCESDVVEMFPCVLFNSHLEDPSLLLELQKLLHELLALDSVFDSRA